MKNPNWAVAVNLDLGRAVGRAMDEDSDPPAFQDFLISCGAGAAD